MTYIEKIVFENFKSFCGTVEMPLEKGFNAIIGPNGSGKSNIVDAIVFVLGASSRAIRAEKLEHLVFNNLKGKSPDFAVVTLYFNNSDKSVKSMDKKFSISRKVDRSGKSIFKLNNKTVSKRKIMEVLSELNIDADSYNIMQQGDVRKILEMRPKERREIIDEVAGIKEYNEKRDKALKELEKAERRLENVELILEEKKHYFEKVKREKEIAEKYEKLNADLERLKANLIYTRYVSIKNALEKINDELREKEKMLNNFSDLSSVEKEIIDLENELEEINNKILEKSVNAKVRKEIEELKLKINTKETKIESLEREKQRILKIINDLKSIELQRERGVLKELMGAGIRGVVGPVYSLFRVDENFQKCIEVAIGNHKDDVVVENEDVAVTCINFLKRNKLGRLRFLPLDRLEIYSFSSKAKKYSKMPGIIDFAINLIEFDRKYEKVFLYVLRDTLIAENLEAAKRAKGVRVVTLDGDLLETSGAIVGGYYKPQGVLKTTSLTRISEYQRQLEKIDNEIENLKEEIISLNQLLNEKECCELKESKEVLSLEKRKKEIRDRLAVLKERRREMKENELLLNSEIQQLRIRKARLEGEFENVKSEFEKHKDMSNLKIGDVEELRAKIRDVEAKIRLLGPVNLRAKEDFEELSIEFKELEAKINKLKEEKNKIIEMINDIEAKRKKIFMETLESLNKRFNEVYNELVGGKAELVLERKDDIESGLMIKVKPKSKKVLSIDSLSGGEKTIVAISFLFAIQRYKPYPFYVLDEIDDALDFANSEKIGELIKKYSSTSQFICISHNDVTIKKADRIYGIVMENGRSKIFGVDFDEKGNIRLKRKNK